MTPRTLTFMFTLAGMLLSLSEQSWAWNTPRYQAIDIGSLPGLSMEPFGMNTRGDIVGMAFNDSSSFAFYYHHRSGSLSVLPAVGGSTHSSARATNDREEVVGTSNFQAVIWYPHGGQKVLGPYPNGNAFDLAGINDSGRVVGAAEISGFGRAVRFSKNEEDMEELLPSSNTTSFASAISNSGFVVGGGPYAFVWRNGKLVNLAAHLPSGSSRSDATAVNDFGNVVGTFVSDQAPGELFSSFFFDRGTMHVLKSPDAPSLSIFARGINNSDEIVGAMDGAFLYRHGQFMKLSSLVTNMYSGFCASSRQLQ